MQEQVNNRTEGAVETTKPNPGKFQRGDPRINRVGRPRKGATPPEPGDRAAADDRLMRLILPWSYYIFRLRHLKGPCIPNLPMDVEVVLSRVDPAQKAIVFVFALKCV